MTTAPYTCGIRPRAGACPSRPPHRAQERDLGAGRHRGGRTQRDHLGRGDHTIRVWDAADGTPIGVPFTGHETVARALAVTGTGDRVIVVSGGDDAVVEAWDLTAVGANTEPFTGHLRGVRSLLFSRVGGRDRLVSGSSDATVRRWDAVPARNRAPSGGTSPQRGGACLRGNRRQRVHSLRRHGHHGADP